MLAHGRDPVQPARESLPARSVLDTAAAGAIITAVLCIALRSVVLVLLVAAPLAAQERSLTSQNPLPALMNEMRTVLADAKVPFTAEQERAIVLMMEDRRQASEELFRDLMDFTAGPTSGQAAERLQSAIAWIRDDFVNQLPDYLTPDQLTAWSRHTTAAASSAAGAGERASAAAATRTQFVRINNNPFAAEMIAYRPRAQSSTDVIQRGGTGGWHGRNEFLVKDDALDARNAFAANKPLYQQRRISLEAGGPAIPGRLTSSIFLTHTESENVDTIHATLPDGVFALGITRPAVTRTIGTRNTYQVSDAHSLAGNLEYGTTSKRNQQTGGFNLPERASNSRGHNWDVELRQFSALSPASVHETHVNVSRKKDATVPATEGVRIDVLDAFGSGGAQNSSETSNRTYGFGNLYTRWGERLTTRAGIEGTYARNRSLSLENFGGTFTFSSPAAYRDGTALTYRVSQGEPFLDMAQWELAAFTQHDVAVTPRLTLMAGARHEVQTNIGDRNNVAPRAGFAYSLGHATVIRGGAGMFYGRVALTYLATQRRLDGTRQLEIVIDGPSYPDPFQSGRVRERRPSVRVVDPRLRNAHLSTGMISVERTLSGNLWVAAMYDYGRETGRLRLRDVNAPADTTAPVPRACRAGQSEETCVRPDPGRGQILSLESSGLLKAHMLRLNIRQRFSIFNVSAEYLLDQTRQDGSPIPQLPMDSHDLRADWSFSKAPVHIISSTVNARLPFGVFLTQRLSAHSGEHYTITAGRDDNRDGSINDRPAGVGRNSETGPKYVNVDFNVSKAFFLGGGGGGNTRTNVNVFANMVNAFNRVHYGLPSGVLTSPNFGRSTSAVQPREIEIGLRFQF